MSLEYYDDFIDRGLQRPIRIFMKYVQRRLFKSPERLHLEIGYLSFHTDIVRFRRFRVAIQRDKCVKRNYTLEFQIY